MPSEPSMKPFRKLIGRWSTEATHPATPGLVVRGSADIEWLEGEHFLIQRSRTDHPDFPDAVSVIGFTERDRVGPEGGGAPQLTMHYFDSRGVFRVYETSIDDKALYFSREAPGFSQRFTGTFAEGGDAIVGLWQLREDDVTWNDDLAITFRRRK